jgi:hypothetical protein
MVTILMRAYFVVLGAVAVWGSIRFSKIAAERWSKLLQRQPEKIEKVYRWVLVCAGILGILFGLLWPPGW